MPFLFSLSLFRKAVTEIKGNTSLIESIETATGAIAGFRLAKLVFLTDLKILALEASFVSHKTSEYAHFLHR